MTQKMSLSTKTIQDLNFNLRAFREEFQTTRPLLPEETRMFTYDKSYLSKGGNIRYASVTEPVQVRLRRLGLPLYERRVELLCDQIRKTKEEIIALGGVPDGYEKVTNYNPHLEEHKK
jgi:hypothetical protein